MTSFNPESLGRPPSLPTSASVLELHLAAFTMEEPEMLLKGKKGVAGSRADWRAPGVAQSQPGEGSAGLGGKGRPLSPGGK